MSQDRDRQQRGTTAEELALLVDAVQDYALVMLGPDGTIRTWNSGACRIFGYSVDAARGERISIFYDQKDRDSGRPARELETAARDGRTEDEGWLVRKDGSRFWANTTITTLYENDGGLRGFALVTRNLTERIDSREELWRSEELFGLLVSSVRDYAIFMLDPGGFVMTWNEGAQRIKGYSIDEVIGNHFSMFYRSEDVERGKPQSLLDVARSEGRVEDEGWRVRKDGTKFWASVLITAVHDNRGELRGFAKVTRDITEKRRAEEMQQALIEQREARRRADEERRLAEASSRAAQEASRSKDEFLMMLSHELRTPLTSVLGWARLLTIVEPDDQLMREGLESIARSAELQSRLIGDVLDVSRIVAGKLTLSREEVELSSVLDQAADQIREEASLKDIELDLSIPDDLGTGTVDPARLEQITWNLLSNAVKFSAAGGRVTLSAKRTDHELEVAVGDEGRGVPAELQPEIFEAFRQADMSVNREHGGLGLGLTIVRYLAQAHGGTVRLESEGEGKGATFYVTISLEGEGEPSVSRHGVHERRARLAGRLDGRCIIVVDDDAENLRVLSSVLEKAGAEVDSVSSVAAALEACSRQQPDLILTDVGMPEAGGGDLLEKLRETELLKEARIVAISAFDFSAEEIEAFDDVLRKPIDPFELVARIEDLLDG